MSNTAATLPSHEDIVDFFSSAPDMVAFNMDVEGVDVRIERTALAADSRLGEIPERIKRLVPYAQAYQEKKVVIN